MAIVDPFGAEIVSLRIGECKPAELMGQPGNVIERVLVRGIEFGRGF